VAGVAGFVLPGDRVDVLLTREAGGGDGRANYQTQVVADNLKVLGVDQIDDETATKPVVVKAITLEVTPEQAQTISLAQAVGTVSLSLRQVSDQALVGKRLTTIADLGGYRGPASGLKGASPRAPRGPDTRVASAAGPKISVTRGVVSTEYAVAR
jgi:pilus assembly protein CpaB